MSQHGEKIIRVWVKSCFLLFDECVSQRKSYKSITIQDKKREWLQKFDLVPGAVHNFVCCRFTYIFFYNNTLRICLCFKAKGHGTRMTSEEQSLKWWGFLQDEMRFALFFVISRTLFYQDYIYMYILLPSCPHFKLDIYSITFQ